MDSSAALTNYYFKVRTTTELICAPLENEDYVVQAAPEASPAKWHLAHTTWFFEELILSKFLKNYQVFNSKFSFLFNSYYESVGKHTIRSERGSLSRPTVKEVYRYRSYVDENMVRLIESEVRPSSDLYKLITLGINHEQQHQELMVTDLKLAFGTNPLFPPYFTDRDLPSDSKLVSPLSFISINGGMCSIGYSGNGFCYDNELEQHSVFLPQFAIANRLITNKEYLEFMEDGGYNNFHLWLSSGFDWVRANNVSSPLYWHYIDGEWMNYTLYGLLPIRPNAPVTHISYYEANAFATWKNKRLIKEEEWENAAGQLAPEISPEANLFDFFTFNSTEAEVDYQLWGNCWEWTGSAYLPYPKFKIADGAPGEYNGKFMNNQYVLRGGSCATPRDHIRLTYRNFFYPHERWQFTGIRLAEYT